jgi:hypothetical protein
MAHNFRSFKCHRLAYNSNSKNVISLASGWTKRRSERNITARHRCVNELPTSKIQAITMDHTRAGYPSFRFLISRMQRGGCVIGLRPLMKLCRFGTAKSDRNFSIRFTTKSLEGPCRRIDLLPAPAPSAKLDYEGAKTRKEVRGFSETARQFLRLWTCSHLNYCPEASLSAQEKVRILRRQIEFFQPPEWLGSVWPAQMSKSSSVGTIFIF